MTGKKLYAIVGLVAVVAVIAAINILGPLAAKRPSLADQLRRAGYLEIRPAANLDGPGTIVTVDSRSSDFVILHATCNMDLDEISKLWQTSPSLDNDIARSIEGEFTVSSDFFSETAFRAGANTETEVKLENTRVLVISDESRMKLAAEYIKGDCQEAAEEAISLENKCVTQPISVMQADVIYNAKRSAKDAASVTRPASLSTDGAMNENDTFTGRGIFVGLKLSGWCIVPNNGAGEKSVAGLHVTLDSIPTASVLSARQ